MLHIVNNSCSLGSQKALRCSRKKKEEEKKLSGGVCGFGKRGVCVLHANATLARCPDQQILL